MGEVYASAEKNTYSRIVLKGSDKDFDPLQYTIVSAPSNGTLVDPFDNNKLVVTGTISKKIINYIPNANFTGEDSFTYKVNDGTADSLTATVQVTIFNNYLYANGRQCIAEWQNCEGQFGDFVGKTPDDLFGRSVSLSSDGKTFVVSAPGHDGIGDNTGFVQVFKFANDEWSQLGQDLNGDEISGHTGWSVSLSGDGETLAVATPHPYDAAEKPGFVRIFQNVDGSWVQLGDDITTDTVGSYFGNSVDLSNNGDIVAIGAPHHNVNGANSGQVRIYRFHQNAWSQLGETIDGENGEKFGSSLSIASDGLKLSAGAPSFASQRGRVGIFQFTDNSWTRMGQFIEGIDADDEFGRAVSLSADGEIVAIGAPGNDDDRDTRMDSKGTARVYQFNCVLANTNSCGDAWSLLGNGYEILGEYRFSDAGRNLALSENGQTLVVHQEWSGDLRGRVQAFKYISDWQTRQYDSAWGRVGLNFLGNNGDLAGDDQGLAVSADGLTVGIGAPYGGINGFINGSQNGYARIFSLYDKVFPEIDIDDWRN